MVTVFFHTIFNNSVVSNINIIVDDDFSADISFTHDINCI